MPPYCPGCNTDCKGGKGLTLHLRLTTNEACHAIFTAAESRVRPLPANPAQEPNRSPEHDDTEAFGRIGMHGLPSGDTAFQGDFFGDDYADDEFGYVSDGGERSEDEEDDPISRDQQDASRAELEDGYEVPRVPEPDFLPNEDVAMQGIVPEGNLNAAPNREARKAAEDHFHHKPITLGAGCDLPARQICGRWPADRKTVQ
ncbi:hypothetical protein DFH07DRAFT_969093 [Mycena maculata]|uniref:Uncharacterized protein n=1 Tax=Mycena maculata TaxID=230809 RepID=A0AAD7HXU6_9AGAR|nr:hypothetical protein DFH07DRAFT_969093 [Mycena maculata]